MEKKIKFKALSWHSSPSRVWPQSSLSLSPNLCHPSLCLCSRLKFIFIDFLLIYTFYLLIKMLTQTSSPTSFMRPSPTKHSTYRFFLLLYYSASASSDDDWHFICLASSVKMWDPKARTMFYTVPWAPKTSSTGSIYVNAHVRVLGGKQQKLTAMKI